MCINHCSSHIAMPQQFLNRPNVVIGLQEVACKTVAKGMGGSPFSELSFIGSPFNGLLNMAAL